MLLWRGQQAHQGWGSYSLGTQSCPLSFVRGSHRKGVWLSGLCASCSKERVLQTHKHFEMYEKNSPEACQFLTLHSLAFYIPREKVLSERFVIARVVLRGRAWKPHLKHSSFFYLCLKYTDMKLIPSESLKGLIPYSFVIVKRKNQEANLTTM